MPATMNEKTYDLGFYYEQYREALKRAPTERLLKHVAKLGKFRGSVFTLYARSSMARAELNRRKAA